MPEAHPHHHLVVAELGRLDRQANAVVEADQGGAEVVDGTAVHHLAGQAEVGVRPRSQLVDGSGLHRICPCVGVGLGQGGFAAVDRLRAGHEHQRPLSTEHLVQSGRHPFRGQALHSPLEQREVL